MLCSVKMFVNTVSCSHVESVVSNELGYFAEEIPKESVGNAAWFPLIAYSKMQGEIDKLRGKLLRKKKQ